jgi:hypothetical protein
VTLEALLKQRDHDVAVLLAKLKRARESMSEAKDSHSARSSNSRQGSASTTASAEGQVGSERVALLSDATLDLSAGRQRRREKKPLPDLSSNM